MTRYLSIYAILILSGCCSTPPSKIGQPSCDQPIPMTGQIWNDLALLRDVDSKNAIIYQECIDKLRSRIERFDNSSL